MDTNLFQVELLSEEEAGINVENPNKETTEEIKKEVTKDKDTPLATEAPETGLLTLEEVDGVVVEEDGTTKVVAPKKESSEISINYKDLAELRIQEGSWEEYENWEELKDSVEWTPELFKKLETEQYENRVQKAIREEKAQFGEQYEALLEHAKNGGSIKELLPSIEKELEIDKYDENSEEDAEELVRAECESQNWSEKRIKTYIESLKDQGNLTEIAAEAKVTLKKILDEEKAEIIAEQKAKAQQAREYYESFNKKIRETIYKDEELSSKEQKEIEKFVFDTKHVDNQTGAKYSEFQKRFADIKNDPAKYAKFVKLIYNFDTVVKKTTAVNEALKNTQFLLRGAQAKLSKNSTSEYPEFNKTKKEGQFNPFNIKKN